MRTLTLSCIVVLAVSPMGCAPSARSAPVVGAAAVANPSRDACAAPVRVAVIQDQTGSVESSLTPQLTADELEPILGLLRSCGGEIRVGEIRGGRASAFAALRVETPPLPVREPPEWPGNPFLRADAKAAFERERASSDLTYARWSETAEPRIQRFRAALGSRWENDTLATRTDIWSALARAALYLEEPESGFDRPLRKWLLAVTDGEHTAGRVSRPARMPKGATLLLVNGDGRQGVLAELQPLRFEGLPAAVRWIVDESLHPTSIKEADDVQLQSP